MMRNWLKLIWHTLEIQLFLSRAFEIHLLEEFQSLLYYRVSSKVAGMSSPSRNLVSSGPDKIITTRKTSPNHLLRAQNLKVIFSLSEVDTKEGQAHVQSRCTLSWRSWLHPWDRCHTATLSGHWFCFSVCTIFGHCTYGKTVKYVFVSISILFPISGQMLTVDFVPGIFVFLSQYEWRSTGLF